MSIVQSYRECLCSSGFSERQIEWTLRNKSHEVLFPKIIIDSRYCGSSCHSCEKRLVCCCKPWCCLWISKMRARAYFPHLGCCQKIKKSNLLYSGN